MLGALSGELGSPEEAISCLRTAIVLQPNFPKAHYNLGNVLRGRGELHEALECFERAVALDPGYVEAWRASAGVHLMLDGLEQAESCCRRAVELVPASADARGQLGQVLAEAGKLEEAAEQFHRVTEIAPGLAAGWMSLARIHQRMEQYTKAEAAIQRAIAIRADTPDAYTVLGDVLAAQNKLDEAINCYRYAIALKPDAPHPHYQLGVTLVARGDPGAAVPSFRRVIELKPDFTEAYNRLGLALHDIQQFHDAIDVYQKLLVLQNNSAGIYSNLGNCHFSLGRLHEAEDCLRVAMQHKPDSPECWSNLAGVLTAQGKHDEAIDAYYHALELDPDLFLVQSNLLLCLNYAARYTPEEVFEAHRSWALSSEAKVTGQMMSHGNPIDPERRLRIGYVSPDLHAHSVLFFIEPLLMHHDRARYEVICYAEVHKPDAITERLRGYVQGWHNICGLDDAKVAKMIQDDGIDILVDLAGHTGHSRILVFARRPAPVQVTYLGYPNTTGLTAMNYRLTDAWADPPGLTERYHSETLVRVPGGFLCYQPDAGCPPVAALPAPGIGHVTFGSFNNLTKVTPEVVALWAKVLHAVPHSRLILKSKALSDEGMCERYYGLFAAQGIDRDRLDFMGRLASLEEHLAIYGQVDIGLDPFPYNGTTTTCEALWMGVPVITLAGHAHAGRVGVSLMSQLGLDDYIAEDMGDYVARAVRLASDLDALAELRAGLRTRMQGSALCDGPGFTRKLEEAYRGMWRTWCASARDDGQG